MLETQLKFQHPKFGLFITQPDIHVSLLSK